MTQIWTKEELLSHIATLKAALKAASTGKSYAIGGRTLTRHDLPHIREQLEYYRKELAKLEGKSSLTFVRGRVIRGGHVV